MSIPKFTDRDALRRHQLDALRRLLGAIVETNPFYGPMLRAAGLDGTVASLDEFIERMPTTTKQMLVDDQQQHPPYGTNLTYPPQQYTRFNQTSSTTGSPMRWLDTTDGWQWMLDNWKQVFAAAEVRPEDRLYFAFSFGPFLGFWTAFDAATQVGCLCLPGGGLSSIGRLEAIRDNRATVLCCTPTYAMRLAEVARAEGIDLADFDVRRIIVAGEPGGSVPAVREALETHWQGATVFDHHGMTEVGPVSYQCPGNQERGKPGSLVVIESSYLAEIVEPESLEPVAPGDVGELVLTTLGREGSPLLRYRTGDLVREDVDHKTQAGGVELTLAGGILGRADDLVQVRGVNVYPSAVADILGGFAEVAEYRVDIRRRDAMVEMRLQIEPVADSTDHKQLAGRIQARLRSRLSLSIPVELTPPGSLPRFEMKARRWRKCEG